MALSCCEAVARPAEVYLTVGVGHDPAAHMGVGTGGVGHASGAEWITFRPPLKIPLNEMTTTARIRQTLKRFRAGIEAGISFLI
jgi:hypothetical protein